MELARRAGVTRQAISAIESNLYLPTTAVALQLASVLTCRVEDLFSLVPSEELMEGTLVGRLPQAESSTQPIRVKVSTIGKRTVVRPVADLGEQLSFAVPTDGYVTEIGRKLSGSTVRVKLSRDRDAIEQEISVAGCDPAIFWSVNICDAIRTTQPSSAGRWAAWHPSKPCNEAKCISPAFISSIQ